MLRNKSSLFSHLGSFLIFLAILVPLIFYGPLFRVEITYRVRKLFFSQQNKTIHDPYSKIVESVPDPFFSLFIPKIEAKSKVYANVSTLNKETYFELLKTGIAHAQGTGLPGGRGNIYLFAHSTDNPFNIIRYNAVFYLLKELEIDDEVFLVYQNKPYRYVVYDRKIIEPTDVSYLTDQSVSGNEEVVLQTCWPPGTVQKRLLIFARRMEIEQATIKTPDHNL